MKILSILSFAVSWAALTGGAVRSHGQSFINLDFEQATVSPCFCQGAITYPWEQAVPGWSHVVANDTLMVFYNAPHIGATPFYLLMDSRSPYYAPDTHLAGKYSLAIASGTTGSRWITAYLSQTGFIPFGTRRLELMARGPFQVLINGIPIEMQSAGGEIYWGNVSAFAGSVAELSIVNTSTAPHTPAIVDNITFSMEPTPPALRLDYAGGVYTQDFNSLSGGIVEQGYSPMPPGWNLWPEKYHWTSIALGLDPAHSAYAVSDTPDAPDKSFALYGGTLESPPWGNQFSVFGTEIRNTSGATLTAFTISFWVEQWTQGILAPDIVILPFEYSLSATNLRLGTFTRLETAGMSPIHHVEEPPPGIQGFDGNDPANRYKVTATVSGLSWTPGSSLWLRWKGSGCYGYCQLLAMDDFEFTAVPTLQIARLPEGSFRLSWSAHHPGFRLQSGASLSGDQWTDVASLPVRNGDQLETTVESTEGPQFFRLVQSQ